MCEKRKHQYSSTESPQSWNIGNSPPMRGTKNPSHLIFLTDWQPLSRMGLFQLYLEMLEPESSTFCIQTHNIAIRVREPTY